MRTWMILLLMVCYGMGYAQSSRSTRSLNGSGWTFAVDPVRIGEAEGWYKPEGPSAKFDPVAVPHCFSIDKRYEFYTGQAWYFFRWKDSGDIAGMRRWLHFDAVFYKSKIWLNGALVGAHEGGYTPFEFDVTGRLRGENMLAVQVDNSWDTTTIPGAKTAGPYTSENSAQVYPWINYGGITRPVTLVSRPGCYIKRVKVETRPDLVKGGARVRVAAIVSNLSGAEVSGNISVRVLPGLAKKAVALHVGAGGTDTVRFEFALKPGETILWDQDHPNLYTAVVGLGSDTLAVRFGIRELRVDGGRLLLNGQAIRMGGANRPLDHPETGSMDPLPVLQQDLGLMKGGCMEMSRINHYAVPEALLDWADSNGLLIIEEAGNWQMTPKQMSDPGMRRNWQSQMREMVERDWNHPSIFAWSVGNEFQSQMQEGKDWVRDMRDFTRQFDSSRLISFASMMLGRSELRTGADEASQYVDFVSANIYGNHLKVLQHIHELYPDKPVFVSEFGIRADYVKDESERVRHLHDAMTAFRQCDYVIGASVWTLQDYRSRFPGSNINGYRPWGLVGPGREIRGMYTAWQQEFAPAVLERVSPGVLRVTARKDFPSYVMKGYRLKGLGQEITLRTLQPGDSQEFNVGSGEWTLVKPNGFIILKQNL